MQAASAWIYQGSYSPVSRQDIFSFCVGSIGGKPPTYIAPHGIGGAATYTTRVVVVAISVVVDIGEIGGGRRGRTENTL
jgi:hypothetical protein